MKNSKKEYEKKDKSKKQKVKLSKKTLVILGIMLLLVGFFFVFNEYKKSELNNSIEKPGTGGIVGGQVQIADTESSVQASKTESNEPYLSNEQMKILTETISSSQFVKDLPKNGVIALRFYDLNGNERVWKNDLLIGREGILSEGTPDLVLIINSKYILQLSNSSLCDVIKAAQANGEMEVEISQSKAKLLLKYSGMLKYRDCFGF